MFILFHPKRIPTLQNAPEGRRSSTIGEPQAAMNIALWLLSRTPKYINTLVHEGQ